MDMEARLTLQNEPLAELDRYPPGEPVVSLNPPSSTPKKPWVGKPKDFTLSRSYKILFDLHKDCGPFRSDSAIGIWNRSFYDKIDGKRRDLLEACLFAYGLIEDHRGKRFSDLDQSRCARYGLKNGLNRKDFPVVLQHENRFVEHFKQNPTVVSRCLQDLISAQFQNGYLPSRQEGSENWIRFGPYLFWKHAQNKIRGYCLGSYQETLHFLKLTDAKKIAYIKAIKPLKATHLDHLEVIGPQTWRYLLQYCTNLLNYSARNLLEEIQTKHKMTLPSGELYGFLPLRSHQINYTPYPSLHRWAYNRSNPINKQALGSRYVAGPGTGYLKNFFDKETLSATAKVYGIYARLSDYNRMVTCKDRSLLLSEFHNEYPVLIPLMPDFHRLSHEDRFDGINELRSNYKKIGLRPAGWRLLKRMSAIDARKLLLPVGEALAKPCDPSLNAAQQTTRKEDAAADTSEEQWAEDPTDTVENVIDFLNEVGAYCTHKPRARLLLFLYQVYKHSVKMINDRHIGQISDPQGHFFRALAMHVLTSKHSVENLKNLCNDTLDMLRHIPSNRMLALIGPRKISPARSIRILQITHDEMLLVRFDLKADQQLDWPCTLKTCKIHPYTFKELTTAFELIAEGQVMGHCVGTYAHRCLAGATRVYSAQILPEDNIKNRLTVSLALQPGGRWSVEQVRGFENRSPSIQEKRAATALCKEFEKAFNQAKRG